MATKNVDTTSVAHFETLHQDWWDKSGRFQVLHDINPCRLQFVTRQVDLWDKQILDVGCGGGILSESLQNAGGQVTGIDASALAIAAARAHGTANSVPVRYLHTTAEDLSASKVPGFDVIVCMELLEHVPAPQRLLRTLATLLQPGGYLFVSTLNRTPLAYCLGIVAAEYLLKIVPKNTHDYQQFIRPAELSGWASHAGFRLLQISGMRYNPLTHHAILHRNVAINYLASFVLEQELQGP